MRQPIVAGAFYEADKEKLIKQIEHCFKTGPGLPKERSDNVLTGIIAPHAGYVFSGKCQAFGYKEIAESKMPDVYIVLGTNHSGTGTATMLDDWKTPLGIIECHKEFGIMLIKDGVIENDPSVHIEEHSIEVQLPFLQYANKDKRRDIRFLPITINHDADYEKIAASILTALKKKKMTATFIASSDFTHFGPNYHYVPFTTDLKKNLYALDKKAIACITKLDNDGFERYLEKTSATICGAKPIQVIIEIAKKMKKNKVKLLSYYTSGDIVKDYKNSVGYASIKIES